MKLTLFFACIVCLIRPFANQQCYVKYHGLNCYVINENDGKISQHNYMLHNELGIQPNLKNIKVFTVATESNDGYERYLRSARNYGIEVNTLGLDVKWDGGDMLGAGGGQKVNLLKQALESYKDDSHLIVLFTDSYDVVFTTGVEQIVQKFKKIGARILFGAEHFCWPDDSLRNVYPSVMAHAPRYLNSGMFMGYASDIYQILQAPIKNADDDQLYYTRIFLDSNLRSKHIIKLDYKSEIFQNLNGAEADVKLNVDADTGEGTIFNINFMNYPSVIHGNGPSKLYLNSFANYLAGAFVGGECRICEENKIVLQENKLPTLSISIFIENAVPFLKEFFEKIADIDYPKQNIFLFIHNNVAYHDKVVQDFIELFKSKYISIKLAGSEVNEREARNLAVDQAILRESDYIFSIDADAHIDDPNIIKDLISFNRTFIAPVLVRPNELWSNFWGALSENGFYARSHDYVDTVKGNIRGMWNVPYVSGCYLIKRKAFNKMSFNHKSFDPDMALCEQLRRWNIFMFVTNTKYYGHLINNDNFNTEVASPDFYTLISNQPDWEKRYIHPDYIEQLNPNYTHKQPCPDVYWFPIVTEEFCKDLINIMEFFGKWSDGSNSDNRLEGGYEAVPTRDIHMNQVGLEKLWLYFLKVYVRPLQEAVFTGYYHNPPKALMNFVVRYRPDEQPFLRPHHDSSTYTINIALNRVGIDYEGGGCKFLRYNCSVTATKMGWMLMHPGRLTHFHEGLRVTNGTRYIMISFVDP